jgi:hypothetical protein
MRNWEQFFESIIIPGIKVDEFLNGIDKADDSLKNVIAGYFNTYEGYIDLEDEDNHIFKVNDLTGDILNNNRVAFTVMILGDEELDKKIKENIVLLSMQEFYSNLPNMLNIYGIDIKPVSFINKDDLEYTFENAITKEEILRIITSSSKGYKYEGEKDGFHLWSKKS